MSEIDRLSGDSDWIDLEFMERERTPEQIVEVGIQLHLAGLSLSNTKQHLENLGVQRSRTAIHNWVQKADRHQILELRCVGRDRNSARDRALLAVRRCRSPNQRIPAREALSNHEFRTYTRVFA